MVSGYGLLQPRVAVDLESANRSHFFRIFAGQGGVDPTAPPQATSITISLEKEPIRGRASDVDAFLACLDRRLPKIPFSPTTFWRALTCMPDSLEMWS